MSKSPSAGTEKEEEITAKISDAQSKRISNKTSEKAANCSSKLSSIVTVSSTSIDRKSALILLTDTWSEMGNADSKTQRASTATELAHALSTVKSKKQKSFYQISMSAEDYDEVYPGIYISSQWFAKTIPLLKKVGITHVLNCAQGTNFMSVCTSSDYYAGSGIAYKGICAADTYGYDLSQHFDDCTEFIDEALKSKGKILVHCLQGFSRSVAITAAYLMKYKGMSAKKAVVQIRSNREVRPNDGFLARLARLDAQLFEMRQQNLDHHTNSANAYVGATNSL